VDAGDLDSLGEGHHRRDGGKPRPSRSLSLWSRVRLPGQRWTFVPSPGASPCRRATSRPRRGAARDRSPPTTVVS
jgi:hypothetical protein